MHPGEFQLFAPCVAIVAEDFEIMHVAIPLRAGRWFKGSILLGNWPDCVVNASDGLSCDGMV